MGVFVMGGPKSQATPEVLRAAFQTDESFKAVAARLGMSPNTLRDRWKALFGEVAFQERSRRLHQAAIKVAQAAVQEKGWVFKDMSVLCSRCGATVLLKSNQVAQMKVVAFVCDGCRCDRTCPVCSLPVDGEKGLSLHFTHRRKAGDVDHVAHQKQQEVDQWARLVLNEDYVQCQLCSYKAETLAWHLKAVHGITAEEYKVKFPGALIRCEKTTLKRQEAARNRLGGFGKGDTKEVVCPGCGQGHTVSKFLVAGTHDFHCPTCRQLADEARWDGKSDPEDYVTCLECGHRAENLTSHIQAEHPGYRAKYPSALVVALISALRDKTAIRGVSRPPEFGEKIREAKLLNLTMEDFKPYLESDGTVDHRSMLLSVGCALPTLQRYMGPLGLHLTNKYMQQAADDRRVALTVEQLEPFKLKNGKVSVAAAVSGLQCCAPIIKRECLLAGLEYAHGNVSQRQCLDAVSQALGGAAFEEEWRSRRFMSGPNSFFRFDGYFSAAALVVEFQGYQHYTFPNFYLPNESYRPIWDKMRERDRIKREMIQSSPDLKYLEVLEDEPFTDISYLRGRLVQLGVLPQSVGSL